jgi:hypothetical protein
MADGGLLHNSVRQVGDAWCVDDQYQVQLDAPRLETLQQADAATEPGRHQMDGQQVEQTGPEALRTIFVPIRLRSLPAAAVRACSTARSMPSVTNVYGGAPVGTVSGHDVL